LQSQDQAVDEQIAVVSDVFPTQVVNGGFSLPIKQGGRVGS
jgi:hypothetical protein